MYIQQWSSAAVAIKWHNSNADNMNVSYNNH